ncbi:MAG TPA: right-handed parallel beta-helix repeat-containing protein [Ktedonobacterales bacterium]|nr:right-handed parallel beta-helix repeat-containing protein [Ktedonobacterales bacterium]
MKTSVKNRRIALLSIIPALALVLAGVAVVMVNRAHANAPSCTPTGFVRDATNLTAAVINPPGTYHGNHGVLDAGGCNIGVYYAPGHNGTVSGVSIFGANYFGVVNNGSKVTVTHNTIYSIGESPLNGDQHGVAIYFAYASGATGSITYNKIYHYQKGGIVVDGVGDSASIQHNTVLGEGPVTYIAQNGIEIGLGAKGNIISNYVSGNSYTGPNSASSAGILLFGGACFGDAYSSNIQIEHNTAIGNDVGLYIFQAQGDCVTPPATVTKNYLYRNTIQNDAINNTTGWGDGTAYQAGIADVDNFDQIIQNTICGAGYVTNPTPPPHIYYIDDTDTTNPVESGNIESPTCASTASNVASAHAPAVKHSGAFKPSLYK